MLECKSHFGGGAMVPILCVALLVDILHAHFISFYIMLLPLHSLKSPKIYHQHSLLTESFFLLCDNNSPRSSTRLCSPMHSIRLISLKIIRPINLNKVIQF